VLWQRLCRGDQCAGVRAAIGRSVGVQQYAVTTGFGNAYPIICPRLGRAVEHDDEFLSGRAAPIRQHRLGVVIAVDPGESLGFEVVTMQGR
jgi:hypothetical protein